MQRFSCSLVSKPHGLNFRISRWAGNLPIVASYTGPNAARLGECCLVHRFQSLISKVGIEPSVSATLPACSGPMSGVDVGTHHKSLHSASSFPWFGWGCSSVHWLQCSLPSGLLTRPVRRRALRVPLLDANHSGFFEPSVVSAVHWRNPL